MVIIERKRISVALRGGGNGAPSTLPGQGVSTQSVHKWDVVPACGYDPLAEVPIRMNLSERSGGFRPRLLLLPSRFCLSYLQTIVKGCYGVGYCVADGKEVTVRRHNHISVYQDCFRIINDFHPNCKRYFENSVLKFSRFCKRPKGTLLASS